MGETSWDLGEIKRLLIKQMVKTNIFLLLFFGLYFYLEGNGKLTYLIGLLCILLWIYVPISIYTIMKEKIIGTKRNKILERYSKHRLGYKRWKRGKITELIIKIILGLILTVLFFVIDFNYKRDFSFINTIPYFFSVIGYNVGAIIRKNKLLS